MNLVPNILYLIPSLYWFVIFIEVKWMIIYTCLSVYDSYNHIIRTEGLQKKLQHHQRLKLQRLQQRATLHLRLNRLQRQNQNLNQNQRKNQSQNPNQRKHQNLSPNQRKNQNLSPNQRKNQNLSPNQRKKQNLNPNQRKNQSQNPNPNQRRKLNQTLNQNQKKPQKLLQMQMLLSRRPKNPVRKPHLIHQVICVCHMTQFTWYIVTSSHWLAKLVVTFHLNSYHQNTAITTTHPQLSSKHYKIYLPLSLPFDWTFGIGSIRLLFCFAVFCLFWMDIVLWCCVWFFF